MAQIQSKQWNGMDRKLWCLINFWYYFDLIEGINHYWGTLYPFYSIRLLLFSIFAAGCCRCCALRDYLWFWWCFAWCLAWWAGGAWWLMCWCVCCRALSARREGARVSAFGPVVRLRALALFAAGVWRRSSRHVRCWTPGVRPGGACRCAIGVWRPLRWGRWRRCGAAWFWSLTMRWARRCDLHTSTRRCALRGRVWVVLLDPLRGGAPLHRGNSLACLGPWGLPKSASSLLCL